jgi:hypothetical protein
MPWFPTFVRQAVTPPVPAWRLPWQSAAAIVESLGEVFAAPWTAHISPLANIWWPAFAVILISVAFYLMSRSIGRQSRLTWLILCFGPPLLLFDLSLIGPPIYHVRYLSTYAPLFVLIVAALLARSPRFFAGLTYSLFALIGVVSIYHLWTDPLYAADDHRSAVATLAQQWRPGDAILANAGWAYPALAVYWPTELPTPAATRPPAITAITRLAGGRATSASTDVVGPLLPIIYTAGSVEGDNSLGWGLPESDFFAVSKDVTRTALMRLAERNTRIWHYRLYDTVSDPQQVIRRWLKEHTTLDYSQAIPGRDFLLLERYRTGLLSTQGPDGTSNITFADAPLQLAGHTIPAEVAAGEMLYVNLFWEHEPVDSVTPSALSLRLYDAQGSFILQSDEQLFPNESGGPNRFFALPVPADTPPGVYYVALVLYAPDTLAPYLPLAEDGATLSIPTALSEVTINLPHTHPYSFAPQASFDYIDLLKVELPVEPLAPGGILDTAWRWRARQSRYSDHYVASVRFVESKSNTVIRIDFDLGTPTYPSSKWATSYPVKQRVRSMLPEELPAGVYQVQLSLHRASDGQLIRGRRRWQPWVQDEIRVGEIEIGAAEGGND